MLNSRLQELAGSSQRNASDQYYDTTSREEKENWQSNKRERNKFEIEKPDNRVAYERNNNNDRYIML